VRRGHEQEAEQDSVSRVEDDEDIVAGSEQGLTVMILNLAPTRAYHMDTISSLNFASRTKKIEVAEVENDPVFRTMVKPLATSSIGGANITRQPLRPLAAAHNVNLPEPERPKKGEKPIKAFSVYSDARKAAPRNSNIPSQNQAIRRTEGQKRAAEPSSTFASRPAKTFRTAETTSRMRNAEPTMTKASIEALIAQRIDEKLAEKALQDAGTAPPALSAELQKRLDDLENRIDAKDDDGKAQGLQFLLMAKQHNIRGEDASALRMFRLAQPFFPGNAKLETKMKLLEDRIRASKEDSSFATKHVSASVTSASAPVPTSNLMAPLMTKEKSSKPKPVYPQDAECENEFAPPAESDHDVSYASDDSFHYKPKAARKPKKTTKKLPIFRDQADTSHTGEQTPRTKHLLTIINSRDINQIKALKGVGAKKADGIVSCLVDMDDAEIIDLESLAMLKGVGGKTVENMRMGLTTVGAYDF
jgi:DNA uptake protein ComE-like DNA-binding protein